ncbi:hypothetical protein [uncultured Cohaesibacter sp.]|uniref:hypothetical protein n=1 Tax=uncultured Cohaesibacter sp. TaxID=1002546 RepID=UPI0029C7E6DD|nr:hypothetical protein [uncultured Cohaesibacter sp.]
MKFYDSVHDYQVDPLKNTLDRAMSTQGKPLPSLFCNGYAGVDQAIFQRLCCRKYGVLRERRVSHLLRIDKKKRHCEQRRFKLSVAPSYMKIVKAWGRWHSVLFISKTYAFVVEAIMEKAMTSSHRCWLFCCFY